MLQCRARNAELSALCMVAFIPAKSTIAALHPSVAAHSRPTIENFVRIIFVLNFLELIIAFTIEYAFPIMVERIRLINVAGHSSWDQCIELRGMDIRNLVPCVFVGLEIGSVIWPAPKSVPLVRMCTLKVVERQADSLQSKCKILYGGFPGRVDRVGMGVTQSTAACNIIRQSTSDQVCPSC